MVSHHLSIAVVNHQQVEKSKYILFFGFYLIFFIIFGFYMKSSTNPKSEEPKEEIREEEKITTYDIIEL